MRLKIWTLASIVTLTVVFAGLGSTVPPVALADSTAASSIPAVKQAYAEPQVCEPAHEGREWRWHGSRDGGHWDHWEWDRFGHGGEWKHYNDEKRFCKE